MMLNVQGLCTGYGRIPILNGVSFAVQVGEFIGILGHNGMGKTTLLKALMGFLPATGGLVRLDGNDVTAAEHQRPGAIKRVEQRRLGQSECTKQGQTDQQENENHERSDPGVARNGNDDGAGRRE